MARRLTSLLFILAAGLVLRCAGDVIATSKGFVLTVEDLKLEIRKLGPSFKYQDTFDGRKAVVQAVWTRKMLADEAERLGLVDRDEIEKVIKEAEKNKVAEVYHNWRIEKRVQTPRIKTKDIRRKLGRRLHLKVMVSKTYKGAEQIARYLGTGADFDSLATLLEGREDFSVRDLGWVLWKDIGPDIGRRVYILEKQDFSEIVRLGDGYHIYWVADDQKFDITEEIVSQRSKRIAKALETSRLEHLERKELGARYDLRFNEKGVMDALKAFGSSFIGERPDEALLESVVATWKGGEIYVADLFQYYYSLPIQSRLYIGDDHGMMELAYEIIMPQLEALAGYDMRIDRIKEVRWHVEKAKEEFLVPAMEDYFRSRIEVTEDEIRDYYERRKADLRTPRSYRAKRLLLNDWEEARTASRRIASGENFEQVVRSMSKDVYTAQNGGDMGTLVFGLVAVYDSVLANMRVGEVSKPFETSSGIEILKLEEIIEPRQLGYDEAVDLVTEFITNTKAEVMLADWIAKKREETGFRINEQLLRKVRLPLPEYTGQYVKPSPIGEPTSSD